MHSLSSLLFFKDKNQDPCVLYLVLIPYDCWYSPCCSSSLLIQVPSIEAGCSVLKRQHPASNPHLFHLWILQTIYSKNAHQYVFIICYGSKRRHPGVIQCSTPERASAAEKVRTHRRRHKQPPPFPPFKAAAQGPFKEPLKGPWLPDSL